MANIGDGYGSECHLLRWMGRHRRLFDQLVSKAVGKPGEPIRWLDFNFNPNRLWPDAELKGFEFLYGRPGLKPHWEDFWPTRGGIQNWDAIGWIGAEPQQELLLLEAKAHIAEMKSNCGASPNGGLPKIQRAFDEVKTSVGSNQQADWTRGYYQGANRIAALYFLQKEKVPNRLLFVYFLGDSFPGKECPRT